MKETKINKKFKIKKRNIVKKISANSIVLEKTEIDNPIWMSISESSLIGGVQNKTIRRAIDSDSIKFKIAGNRYLVDLKSLIKYLHTKTKLANKLAQFGIGQYIEKWKE